MLVQKLAEEANAASGTATTAAVVAQVFEDVTKHLPALLVPVQKVLVRALAFDCLRKRPDIWLLPASGLIWMRTA